MTGFNNNGSRPKGLKLFKLLALVGFMIDIITVGAIFIVLGHDAGGPQECTSVNGLCPHDSTSLGVWKNFPTDPCCLDKNELMFNTSYRVVVNAGRGIAVAFQVSCITPSNTVGAALQLQQATYSSVTLTNTTNFSNVGIGLKIDNSANFPCPGNLLLEGTTNLASGQYLFRIMGSGGGGTGDNPRFSNVLLNVYQRADAIVQLDPGVISTTGFTVAAYANVPQASTLTETILWRASNVTGATQCGLQASATSHCFESGSTTCSMAADTSSCTVSVTFAVAFTGTVFVICQSKNVGTPIAVFAGSLSFLQAQTLTV